MPRLAKRRLSFATCTFPDCDYDATDGSDECYYHDKISSGIMDKDPGDELDPFQRLLIEWDVGGRKLVINPRPS